MELNKPWKQHQTLIAILVLLSLFCSAISVVAFLSLVRTLEKPTPEIIALPTGIQPESPEVPNTRQIHHGEKLFMDMRARSPAVLQVRDGGLLKGATATLIIPRPLWNRLAKPDQVSLTFFAESLIPDIRADPATFADVPATDPTYTQVVNNIANLCDSCWAIVIGEIAGKNRITIGETVVQGNRAWEKDYSKSGVKVSEFYRDF